MNYRVLWSGLIILITCCFVCLSCGNNGNPQETKPELSPQKLQPISKYSEFPTLAMIPNTPIQGMINDRYFQAKTVYFEPSFNSWSIKILEKECDDIESINNTGMGFDIELDGNVTPGTVLKRELEIGEGVLTYYVSEDRLNTWSGENAWIIEISKWEAAPYDPSKGNRFQIAGKASGRIAVSFRGDNDGEVKNSWAAGLFTDVPIVYFEKPKWNPVKMLSGNEKPEPPSR